MFSPLHRRVFNSAVPPISRIIPKMDGSSEIQSRFAGDCFLHHCLSHIANRQVRNYKEAPPDGTAGAVCPVCSDNTTTRSNHARPETMQGAPVFCGTRVPVQTLFEYLEGGDTLEDFLEGFPTVSRDLAVAVLQEANQLLLTPAS